MLSLQGSQPRPAEGSGPQSLPVGQAGHNGPMGHTSSPASPAPQSCPSGEECLLELCPIAASSLWGQCHLQGTRHSAAGTAGMQGYNLYLGE